MRIIEQSQTITNLKKQQQQQEEENKKKKSMSLKQNVMQQKKENLSTIDAEHSPWKQVTGNRQKKKFPRKMQHVEPIKKTEKKTPIVTLIETNNNNHYTDNNNDNNNDQLHNINEDDDENQYSEISTTLEEQSQQQQQQKKNRPKHYVENIVYNFPFNSLPEEGHIFIFEGGISVGKSTIIKNLLEVLKKLHPQRKIYKMMEEINQNLLKLYLDAMPRPIISIINLLIFLIVMGFSFMFYYLNYYQSEHYSFNHFMARSIHYIIFTFGYFYYISKRNQYALAFQIIMIRDRIETLRNAIRLARAGSIVFIDRGIMGDISFFIKQYKQGMISRKEYIAYVSFIKNAYPEFIPQMLYKNFLELDPKNLLSNSSLEIAENDVETDSFENYNQEKELAPIKCTIVHMDANAKVAFERLRMRGNKHEINSYTIGYFEELISTTKTLFYDLKNTYQNRQREIDLSILKKQQEQQLKEQKQKNVQVISSSGSVNKKNVANKKAQQSTAKKYNTTTDEKENSTQKKYFALDEYAKKNVDINFIEVDCNTNVQLNVENKMAVEDVVKFWNKINIVN